MPRESIPLVRDGGFKDADKLFVLSYEGEKTEVKYFNFLRNSEYFNDSGIIEIIPLKREVNSGTDPISVKKLLKKAKDKFPFKKTDEFWLIIDRDDWETIHKINFEDLSKDCKAEENFFLAMSNPCFEVWLILHLTELSNFDKKEIELIYNNNSISNTKNYIDKVLGELQGRGYNKNPKSTIYLPLTNVAINNAKKLDNGKEEYPIGVGTHVYKLIEKLIK